MASQNMTLKLLVHKVSKKVLYAEAPKEFVDFLLHFFSLPLGALIQLVGSKQMVGCLGKLKESVEGLNQIYLQPGINTENIFNSNATFSGNAFLMPDGVSANDKPATSKRGYKRRSFFNPSGTDPYEELFGRTTAHFFEENTWSADKRTWAGTGGEETSGGETEWQPVVKKQEVGKLSGGFVKEAVTYMVMDDLVVKPFSTVTIMTFVKSYDLTQFEEKTLHIGEEQALKLLKASISTNEVLTTLLRQTKDA